MTLILKKDRPTQPMQSEPKQLNVIELALLGLAGVCDGAHSHDGQGFNGTDTKFGKSLAAQIQEGRSLTYKQAKGAIKILPKYAKQLAAMELTVPTQDDFRALYKSPQRVEIIDGEIAVFLPYPDRASIELATPKGRYNEADRSFRYWLSDALALNVLLSGEIEKSPEFLELLASAAEQKDISQTKRIDLLPDEHPDRCVAVYFPSDPSKTVDPEFFWFRDKVDRLGGVHEPSDNSWRFPLTVIGLLLIDFPAPAYHHSERFLKEFDPIDCGF